MTAVAKLQELLGGEAVIGALRDELDVVRLIRSGVPTAAVDRLLQATKLGFPAIERNVLARRTFNRRREAGEPLDAAESDRLVRFAGVVAQAEETFGERAKALAWLSRGNRLLGGQPPLAMIDTDVGARAVEAILGRIAHGLAA